MILEVTNENLPAALKTISNATGVLHLSTITGQDAGDSISLDYQFSEPNRIIAVRTTVPKTVLSIGTCTGILPGAILYEMEIHDMFGVTFNGNPWMDRKLLLPDNYPQDMPPPLLKSTDAKQIRKAVGIEQ